jgi:hypothetical protein
MASWSTPRVAAEPTAVDSLSTPAAPGSAEPNLAVGRDGRVYLSWLEPTPDSAFALRLSSFAGGAWSAPRTIRSGRDFFVNWADFPSVEVLSDGRLAAHWLQRTGKPTYAYAVRVVLSADDGATWTTPLSPHTDTSATEHGFVTLWQEGQGLGAAWLDGRQYDKTNPNATNEMAVVTTRISKSGARGAETFLDRRACDCCQVAAAVTSEGPVVVYRDRSPDEIRDIAVVRRVKGTWTQPAPLNRDNWHIASCPVNGPAIAASGRAVAVAWFTAANDSARVKLAFSSDAGATFGAPIRVDEGAPAGRVDVALLKDGSGLVTWVERVGGDTALVRARRVSPTGTAGPPMTVAASSSARTSGFPRMVLSGDTVFFAWTQPTRPSQVRVARRALSALR